MDAALVLMVSIGFVIFLGGLWRIRPIARARDVLELGVFNDDSANYQQTRSYEILAHPESFSLYRPSITSRNTSQKRMIILVYLVLGVISSIASFYWSQPLLLGAFLVSLFIPVFYYGPGKMSRIELYILEIPRSETTELSHYDSEKIEQATTCFSRWIILQLLFGMSIVLVAVQPVEFHLLGITLITLSGIVIALFGTVFQKSVFTDIKL